MHESSCDERFMRMALELAERGLGYVEPNPMVGCVIVRDQTVIASGFHQRFGGPHAEIEALSRCDDASNATAYVTLEPCCHHGKTPPCSDALIRAGVKRVVVAIEDPFEKVAGGGLARIREAGIETAVGVLRCEAEFLCAPYLKRLRTAKPWVIGKWAMTADGRIATVSGESRWITGESARAQVHRLRARVDAVAVGMGTVEADDPLLTARPEGPRLATRVVFCRNRLPRIDSKLVQSARTTPLALVIGPSLAASPQLGPLERCGAELVRCQSDDRLKMIEEALELFSQRPMTNVMVEGGAELLSSFFSAGQLDECHVYVGAKAFGGTSAPGPIAGAGVEHLTEAMSLSLVSVDQFDNDIRAVYRKV